MRIQSAANRRRRTSDKLRSRRSSRDRVRRSHQPGLRGAAGTSPPGCCRGTGYIDSSIRCTWFAIAHGIVCTAPDVVFRATVGAIAVRPATVVWSRDGLAVDVGVEGADAAAVLEEDGGGPAVV